MTTEASVTLHCRVHDEQVLWCAAYGRYEQENGTQDQADVEEMLGTKAEPDVGACLQMLLDPGSSPAPEAFDIEQSESTVY
jgi:hypothetical protein